MILEVFGKPWMMTEPALQTLIAIASRDEYFAEVRKQALDARDGAPLKNSRAAYTRGTVCIIPVSGPLIRHADMFSEISGATSYAALRKDLQVALDDPSVRSILFNIDSPGGEVNGCFELADAIFAARSRKPVRAYVGGMGASAAYAIASACETIGCAEAAELGSIGVRSGYLDDSAAMQAIGLKQWTFVSSVSPYKAFDVNVEDDRGRLQVVLDDLANVFVEKVARGRDVTVDAVLQDFGQGDVMVGARAVAAGLADQLTSFEELVEAMDHDKLQTDAIRAAAQERRKMSTISTSKPTAASAAGGSDEWQCAGCNEMMGKSAKSFCAKCAEDDDDDSDDEDAAALGLAPKASSTERRTRMVALVLFEKSALAAVGESTAASALGKIAAGALAIGQAEGLRRAAEDQQKVALQQQFAAALVDKRLSLGHLTAVVPTFLSAMPGKPDKDGNPTPSERAKAQAAIAALPSQTREGVIEALSTATVTADTLETIKGFASVQTALPETPRVEPPLDSENRITVLKVSKEEAAKFGMKPESFEKFANITSVDQIERPAPKQGA